MGSDYLVLLSSPVAVGSAFSGMGTMASVQREMQMIRPASSTISIDHTCVERPR